MKSIDKKKMTTKELVLLSLLAALVAILSYFGGFIKIGGFASISLTLIPVVLGAALLGAPSGAFLGAVSGIVFFLTPDAAFWLGLSVHGTVITVMLKGILAGFLAGLTYKYTEKHNRYIATVLSAVVCPLVNTSVFLMGCLVFFIDSVSLGAASNGMSLAAYLLVFFVGLNFVFELVANVVLSPAIVRVIDVAEKKRFLKKH